MKANGKTHGRPTDGGSPREYRPVRVAKDRLLASRRPEMRVPLLDLAAQHAAIREDVDAAIQRVFSHAQFVQGPEVADFEQAFARYCEARHCVGVANGTVAIELVLRAAGIGTGDEVVTTAMTFIATVEGIVLAGGTPVLVDVDPDTALIDIDAVEAAITPRTAAIVPVHLYGQTVDLDAFRQLADRRGVLLLEDAAQAHGARWRARCAGSVGDAATFSFFPGKNLGALGDAGAVTTSDDELARRIRKLRDHGRVDKYRHDELGTNARLDTLQAAVLAVKLRRLDEWNAARRRHAHAYDEAFAPVEGITPLRVAGDAIPVYHQYVVRIQDRKRVRREIADRGIASGVHYPVPVHRQPAVEHLFAGEFPVADALAREVLSLPVFPELTDAQRSAVIEAVAAATSTSTAAVGAEAAR
jgi:dTDP-4-amino-4,6-dideoxygalactose transaminase